MFELLHESPCHLKRHNSFLKPHFLSCKKKRKRWPPPETKEPYLGVYQPDVGIKEKTYLLFERGEVYPIVFFKRNCNRQLLYSLGELNEDSFPIEISFSIDLFDLFVIFFVFFFFKETFHLNQEEASNKLPGKITTGLNWFPVYLNSGRSFQFIRIGFVKIIISIRGGKDRALEIFIGFLGCAHQHMAPLEERIIQRSCRLKWMTIFSFCINDFRL